MTIRRLCGLPRFDQEVAFIDADYQRLLREMEANPLIERGPSVYGPDAHTGPITSFFSEVHLWNSGVTDFISISDWFRPVTALIVAVKPAIIAAAASGNLPVAAAVGAGATFRQFASTTRHERDE